MPIVIKRHDYTIEVDSESELRTVLRVLHERQLPLAIPDNSSRGGELSLASVVDSKTVKVFVRGVKTEKGRKFIQALRDHPEGQTDAELRTQLGISRKFELPGVITGLVKAAKRAGIQFDVIVSRSKEWRQGQRVYTYKLTQEALEAARSG